jgi:hypothetical protein
MDTLPVSPPRESLTTAHLRSAAFQKLNKDLLIQNYIHGQKLHTKAYAAEGHAIFSTWGSRTPPKPAEDLTVDTRFGFDTPVLKPRVAQAPDKSPKGLPSAVGGDEDEQDRTEHIQERPEPPKKAAKHKNPSKRLSSKPSASRKPPPSPSPIVREKPVCTKRKACEDVDEEYVARKTLRQLTVQQLIPRLFLLLPGLDERRERKRTKRAIVKPTEQPTIIDDDENPSDTEGSKKRKGKKAKNSKLQAGFALMHGFAATNVGQNRLTVGPRSSACRAEELIRLSTG